MLCRICAGITQAGVPQNHFVAKDGVISFQYYPNTDENLLVSLVARSGDPDLFIGAGSVAPSCESTSSGYSLCSNYTWSSRMFSTDQIFISTDEPCTGMLPTTIVSYKCDPESAYTASSSVPVNILVLGFRESQFTIVVSPSGGLRRLLPGQPQLSLATLGVLCKERNNRGTCVTSRTQVEKTALVATFSFFIAAPSLTTSSNGKIPASIGDVLITVLPQCANESSTVCYPGCACNPLQIWADSCAMSSCGISHRHPADLDDSYAAMRSVDPTGSTLSLSTSSSNNCDPLLVGEGCVYFITVTADFVRDSQLPQAAFTISARTPFDIALVPCSSAGNSPDGLRFEESDVAYADAETVRNYEVCASAAESTVVTLEQCTGNTLLYACASDDHCANVLPTDKNWDYYSDGINSCYRRWINYGDTSGWGKEVCTPLRSNEATLSLSPMNGNYFLGANGSGQYILRVEDTKGGKRISPALVATTVRGAGWQGKVEALSVTGNTAHISWTPTAVLLPGNRLPTVATSMKYLVYAIDINAFKRSYFAAGERPALSTPCGLEAALHGADNEDESVFIRKYIFSLHVSDQGAASVERELSHLFPKRTLNITVVAVCDSDCLRYVSRTHGPDVPSNANNPSCSGPGSCHTQYLVYPSIQIYSLNSEDGSAEDKTAKREMSLLQTVVYGSIGTVLVLAILTGVMWMSYAKKPVGDAVEGIQLQDYSTTAQSSEHGSGNFKIEDDDDLPARYVPPTALARASNGIKSLMTDSETVNSFMGSVGNVGRSMTSSVQSALTNGATATAAAANRWKQNTASNNTNNNTSRASDKASPAQLPRSTYSPLVTSSVHGRGGKLETKGPFGKFDDDDEEVSVDL